MRCNLYNIIKTKTTTLIWPRVLLTVSVWKKNLFEFYFVIRFSEYISYTSVVRFVFVMFIYDKQLFLATQINQIAIFCLNMHVFVCFLCGSEYERSNSGARFECFIIFNVFFFAFIFPTANTFQYTELHTYKHNKHFIIYKFQSNSYNKNGNCVYAWGDSSKRKRTTHAIPMEYLQLIRLALIHAHFNFSFANVSVGKNFLIDILSETYVKKSTNKPSPMALFFFFINSSNKNESISLKCDELQWYANEMHRTETLLNWKKANRK